MPRSTRRKQNSSLRLLSRLFYPVRAVLGATGNSVRRVTRTAGNIASKTVNTVGKVGSRFINAGDNSIRALTTGKGSKSHKGRKSRKANKSRKNNMRH